MIVLKIAGVNIGVDNKYRHTEIIAKDYIVDEAPEFCVSVTPEDIKEEREMAEIEEGTDGYFESVAIYRKIAEKMPHLDGALFHGATIEYEGGAYIITAHSGVGKTTHLRLWLSEFGDEVSVVNGDKPIIRFIDGVLCACGTPWQGKEDYGRNVMRPLKGIIFLERGEKNYAYPTNADDAAIDFMRQIYLPKTDKLSLMKTMNIANRVLKEVKLVRLECNMDPEAAHVARAAILADA